MYCNTPSQETTNNRIQFFYSSAIKNKQTKNQTNQPKTKRKKKGKETAGYSLGRHKNYSFLKFSSGNMHRHVAILTTTKLTTCPIQINQANTVKIKDCSESVCRNPAYQVYFCTVSDIFNLYDSVPSFNLYQSYYWYQLPVKYINAQVKKIHHLHTAL